MTRKPPDGKSAKDWEKLQKEMIDNGQIGSLATAERLHIDRMLRVYDWNMSATARALNIDRTTLYNKVKLYKLEPEGRKVKP